MRLAPATPVFPRTAGMRPKMPRSRMGIAWRIGTGRHFPNPSPNGTHSPVPSQEMIGIDDAHGSPPFDMLTHSSRSLVPFVARFRLIGRIQHLLGGQKD